MHTLQRLVGWTASLFLCTSVCAEDATERLQVRILDVSGGTIAGAKVSLLCDGARTRLEGYSDDAGLASFTVLIPAICTATAEANKFEAHVERLEVKRDLTQVEIPLRPLHSKTEIVVA